MKGGGSCGEKKQQSSLMTVVGMKEANPFHTFVCFVTHTLGGGKIYSNFTNATVLPPTCIMP